MDKSPPRWLEHLPREWEVVGSIRSRDRPKSLQLVVVAIPVGTQDYGNSTMTAWPVTVRTMDWLSTG